jgi:hypothetical protein
VSKVVPISNDIYPIEDVIKDLSEIKDKVKDLVIITILEDCTAYVTHTGLNFLHMALACKLLDKEFNNLIDNVEEDTLTD